MTEYKFSGKIKLEDGSLLLLQKSKYLIINLTKVTEIHSSFIGALFVLKNKSMAMITNEYIDNILKMKGVYNFLEKHIIN